MFNGNRVVVTMTSWTKRMGNCVKVIQSILDNTVKPDIVFLNLSLEEFPNRLKDLPKDLVELSLKNPIVKIHWIPGPNTKTMKKVFPILKYLDDDDIIINCDDDSTFSSDFINIRLKQFQGCRCPITSCNNPDWHYVDSCLKIWCCGPASLMTKRMLFGYQTFVDDSIVKTYNDDWTYTTIALLNGYRFIPCNSYPRHTGIDINNTRLNRYNEVEPMGKKGGYYQPEEMKRVLFNRVGQLYGKKIDSFSEVLDVVGKHDVVLLYTDIGVSSQSMKGYGRLEIEYVIASLKKYCSSWLNRIIIVGDIPNCNLPKGVMTIKVENKYKQFKSSNIWNKIREAIVQISDLSDDFIFASDDQIVTFETRWDDIVPYYVRQIKMSTIPSKEKFILDNVNRNAPNIEWEKKWNSYLFDTLSLFKRDIVYQMQPHVWMKFNKDKFMDMCGRYDWENHNYLIGTTYYNTFKCDKYQTQSHTYFGVARTKPWILKNMNNNTRWFAWTDTAFQYKEFRDKLFDIVR